MQRPILPRYDSTWDVDCVFQLFVRWGSNGKLSLSRLRQKCIILCCLDLLARASDLAKAYRHFVEFRASGELAIRFWQPKE